MIIKPFIKKLWDLLGIPFRFVLFDQAWLSKFGWTTLEEERLNAVLPHVRGRLLDIGAGLNNLVKKHGQGVGVDIFDWGGGALVVEDSACLPFPDAEFDTVSLVACLNHIPNRLGVLKEAERLLKPGGRLIVTMINPLLGGLGHKIWWYSEDKIRGGMKEGEVGGMWDSEIIRLARQYGFKLARKEKFNLKLVSLLVFEHESFRPGPSRDAPGSVVNE